MEVPGEENQKEEANYDPMEGWLKLVNILHDATPIITEKMIPKKTLLNVLYGATPNITERMISEETFSYSETFHAYVRQNKDKLLRLDRDYLPKFSAQNFVEGIDLPRLNRLLCKVFPTIHTDDNKKKFELLMNSRNDIVHEGKLLVATKTEFDYCFDELRSRLEKLGVEDNQIRESMGIVVKDRNKYDALVKQTQDNQDERQKLLEQISSLLSKEDHNWKVDVQPIKSNSPHKEKSEVLAEVFGCGTKHKDYGKYLERLDGSFFYVNDEEFEIGERVYVGYHDHQWIALKKYLTVGEAKPQEVKMMLQLGTHCPDGHENVIKMIKGFSNRHLFYLAMPLCDYTLDVYCKKKSPTAIQRAKLGKQLLKAMTFLHEDKTFLRSNENSENSGNGNGSPQGRHGIVHRDLKPNNVLISMVVDGDNLGATKPLLKLADFGMSVESAKKDKTIKAKGVSAWEWRAPGANEIENSPVWYENDVFVTNALLAYILSSNHLHPFKLEEDNENDLRNYYNKLTYVPSSSLATMNLKLDIHEDLRDLLNENFQNYFEFFSIKEKRRNASRQQRIGEVNIPVVTEADKEREEELKDKLKIEKIKDQYTRLYSVKHPEATPGKRFAIIVTCNGERLSDEANEELVSDGILNLKINEKAPKEQKWTFRVVEDPVRIKLKKCNFIDKPEVKDLNKKESVDMEKKKLLDIVCNIDQELDKVQYSNKVYLFLWIVAHGKFDAPINDSCIEMGKHNTEAYVKELLTEVQNCFSKERQPEVNLIVAIDCCREGGEKENKSDSSQKNVFGLFSVKEGCYNGENQTGTGYQWHFATTVAQKIEPGETVGRVFDGIIKEMEEKYKSVPEKFSFNDTELMNFTF